MGMEITTVIKLVPKTKRTKGNRYGVRNHPLIPGSDKYTLPYCQSVLTDNPEGVINLLTWIMRKAEWTDEEKEEIAGELRVDGADSVKSERNLRNVGRTMVKSAAGC